MTGSPYRLPSPAIARYAFSVGWTRWASHAVGAASLVVPTFVVHDLIADEDCKHVATPHWEPAVGVVLVVPLAIFCGLFLQRRWARCIASRVRVRSSVAGALHASATLVPNVVIGVAAWIACAWISFAYTWDLCLDMDWSAFSSILHC